MNPHFMFQHPVRFTIVKIQNFTPIFYWRWICIEFAPICKYWHQPKNCVLSPRENLFWSQLKFLTTTEKWRKKIRLKMYGKMLTLQKIEILIRHFCISAGYKLVYWRGLWIHQISLYTKKKIVTKAGKNYS